MLIEPTLPENSVSGLNRVQLTRISKHKCRRPHIIIHRTEIFQHELNTFQNQSLPGAIRGQFLVPNVIFSVCCFIPRSERAWWKMFNILEPTFPEKKQKSHIYLRGNLNFQSNFKAVKRKSFQQSESSPRSYQNYFIKLPALLWSCIKL